MPVRANDREELAPATGVRALDAALIAYGRAFEHPSKIRIVRALARRLAGNRILVRYAPGATIAIDPSDYVGWAIFKTGQYESASLSLALRLMRQDPGLFIDVGAGFGWYTCAVAAIPGANVMSIEPDCESCAALRRNLTINHRGNVTVFGGAAGSAYATLRMTRRAATNSGTTAIVPPGEEDGPGGNWVAAVPLQALLERVIRPATRPVLIKLDVEGSEREALMGLDFAGPFRPKNILIEFVAEFRAWASLDDVRAFLAARGYRVCDVRGRDLQSADDLPEANIWAREEGV